MDTRFLFTLMHEQAVCLLFLGFRMKCTKTMYFPVSFRSFLAGYQGHPRTSWITAANPLLVINGTTYTRLLKKWRTPIYNRINK